MSNQVVTSQPTPSVPLDEKAAMTEEIATDKIIPTTPPIEPVVVTQPMPPEVSEKLMYAQTESMPDEEEAKRIQRNQDYCCFAWADSCATTEDTWCWYIMCRMYCQCLGVCCESCANCLDSCGEGCASCLHGCCESENVAETSNDCCGDCDCSGCDCDCGGCDCDCFN